MKGYRNIKFWLSKEGGHYPFHVLARKADVMDLVGRWREAGDICLCLHETAMLGGGKKLQAESKKRLGKNHLHQGSFPQAIELLSSSYLLYLEIGDEYGAAGVLGSLGAAYLSSSDYAIAAEKFTQLAELAERIGDKSSLGYALGGIGNICRRQGDLNKAKEYQLKRLALARETEDRLNMSYTLGNLGLVHWNLGELDQAMDCFQQTLAIARETGEKLSISLAIGNIANIHYERGQYVQALENYLRQYALSMEMGDRQGMARALSNAGAVQLDLGDLEQALESCRKALEISQQMGERNIALHTISNIGNILNRTGKHREALEYFNRMLDMARELGDAKNHRTALLCLGHTFRYLNDHITAGEYYRRTVEDLPARPLPPVLCEILHYRALASFLTGSPDTARHYGQESLVLSRELKKNRLTLKNQLLQARLDAAEDPAGAAARLEMLLEEYQEAADQADIFYALYQLLPASHYRSKALEKYTALQAGRPQHKYRIRVTELEGQRQEAMPKIQAMILDLGNVVLNYDHGRSVKEIARISGGVEKEVESFIFGSLKDRFNRGQVTKEEFFGLIKDRFNLKVSFEDFHLIWSNIFSENLDVTGVLPELCKNYPVYLLTNTDILHFDYILTNFPVVSQFNQVFASHQMGTAKPDPEIYQRALAEIGLSAEAVLYVDDEPSFVEAARFCGINALLYRPEMKFKNELLKFGISI